MNLIIDPAAREEEEVIDASDTDKLLDVGYNHPEDVVTVEGVIVWTCYAEKSKGEPTFVEFHDPYKDRFMRTWPPNPETHFLSKKVRVKGKIGVYKGDIEIVLHDPSRI